MSGIKTSIEMQCTICGKTCLIPKYRQATFLYCSRKCQYEGIRRKPKIKKICKICGNIFEVIPVRDKTAKYCSRQCYNKSLIGRGSVDFICIVCGKTFKAAPSRINSTKRFCSIKCRGEYFRVPHAKTFASVRKWMSLRGLIERCEKCGYIDHPEILEIHHKDKNRHHNKLENLQVLCPNCHKLEHYGIFPPKSRD